MHKLRVWRIHVRNYAYMCPTKVVKVEGVSVSPGKAPSRERGGIHGRGSRNIEQIRKGRNRKRII